MTIDTTTIKTFDEIVDSAKWFYFDPIERHVTAYTEQIGEGWRGYDLRVKYLHEVGFYWDITPLYASSNAIDASRGCITANKETAFNSIKGCPKCGKPLFDTFSNDFHKVATCGTPRKAIATNVIG